MEGLTNPEKVIVSKFNNQAALALPRMRLYVETKQQNGTHHGRLAKLWRIGHKAHCGGQIEGGHQVHNRFRAYLESAIVFALKLV